LFAVLLFLCHTETSRLQEYHQDFSYKFRLSIVSRCIGAHHASLTFHAL